MTPMLPKIIECRYQDSSMVSGPRYSNSEDASHSSPSQTFGKQLGPCPPMLFAHTSTAGSLPRRKRLSVSVGMHGGGADGDGGGIGVGGIGGGGDGGCDGGGACGP